jgi:hypothetical protein
LPHKQDEILENLTTMACHRHYRHQAGSLVASQSLVNARNTNKPTKVLTWTIGQQADRLFTLQKHHVD